MIFMIVGCCLVAISWMDPNGGFDLFPRWIRALVQSLQRLVFDVYLFETCRTYRNSLGLLRRNVTSSRWNGKKNSHDDDEWYVAPRLFVAAMVNAATTILGIVTVPEAGRRGCELAAANTAFHVGASILEIWPCVQMLHRAKTARKFLASHCGRELTSSKKAVDVITSHIYTIIITLGLLTTFTIYASTRNALNGRFTCLQPSCSPATYPATFLWAIWYQIGGWFWVLMMIPNNVASRCNASLYKIVIIVDCIASGGNDAVVESTLHMGHLENTAEFRADSTTTASSSNDDKPDERKNPDDLDDGLVDDDLAEPSSLSFLRESLTRLDRLSSDSFFVA